jgi:phospholipid/cholesterol/gamma-HCH transport system permease protein
VKFGALGDRVSAFGREVSYLALVLGRATRALPRMRAADFREQLGRVALSALPLVGVAALFIGLVIALISSVQLSRLGQSHLVADAVSLALVGTLAPIFTALLMAGKAGAGLASELGMVTLSGQAQAMRAMSVDIDRELIAPRVWACVVGTVLLTIAAMLLGLFGGMVLAAVKLDVSPMHFMSRMVEALAPTDIAQGLIKSACFGLIIATMGTAFGLKAKADAAVLGHHTMRAVVLSSFLILVSDYILTTLILAVFS